MQMGMKKQILPPTVEYSEESDLRTQMLGIGSDGGQGLGSGTEENVVGGPLVLERDVGNLFRHCKDNVKIRNVKKLGLSVLDPLGACQRLAFWTVTIRTRIEPDALVTAPVAHLDVTAESGGAA